MESRSTGALVNARLKVLHAWVVPRRPALRENAAGPWL